MESLNQQYDLYILAVLDWSAENQLNSLSLSASLSLSLFPIRPSIHLLPTRGHKHLLGLRVVNRCCRWPVALLQSRATEQRDDLYHMKNEAASIRIGASKLALHKLQDIV